jgi:hypothetical protein
MLMPDAVVAYNHNKMEAMESRCHPPRPSPSPFNLSERIARSMIFAFENDANVSLRTGAGKEGTL